MTQPDPKPNTNKPIYYAVMDDLMDRASAGFDRYGTYLQPNNGRDALWDAYEEVLDLAMYLRQAIAERRTR